MGSNISKNLRQYILNNCMPGYNFKVIIKNYVLSLVVIQYLFYFVV